MKKKILTIVTDEIEPYCQSILDTHRLYAAKNGYEHHVVKELHWPDLHPSYSRVWDISKTFEDKYDFLIWADADVAFMDSGFDLIDLLEPDYYLAAYWQRNWDEWKYLCAGLSVWRNDERAKRFAKEWIIRVEGRTQDIHPWEQTYWDQIIRETNYEGVRVCLEHEIGCFSNHLWNDTIPWKIGYPTVHLGGQQWDWPTREKLFLKHYRKFVR